MSRRFPDMRITRDQWSTGDAIAAGVAYVVGLVGVILAIALFAAILPAHARDNGRYADSALKSWFDSLASGNGLCCSFADGFSVSDVDWDTHERKYRVRLDGEWIVVPDEAVVTVPNKFGSAVVWPYKSGDGETLIRCFIAGTLS